MTPEQRNLRRIRFGLRTFASGSEERQTYEEQVDEIVIQQIVDIMFNTACQRLPEP